MERNKKRKIISIIILIVILIIILLLSWSCSNKEDIYGKAIKSYIKAENLKITDKITTIYFRDVVEKGHLKKEDYKKQCLETSYVDVSIVNSKQTINYKFTCTADIRYFKMDLVGKEEVIVEYGDTYKDLGVTIKDNGKQMTPETVEIDTSKINYEKIGTYEVIYKYKLNEKAKITRKVKIVDTKSPVLTLNSGKDYLLEVNSKYKEQGAKATDNYDQDLTDKIKIKSNIKEDKLGDYEVTYSVEDSSGNKSEIKRTVKVVDRINPTISIKGNSIILERTKEYDLMEGVTATDNYDLNIKDKIKIESTPGFNKEENGVYQITYNVLDSSGNKAVTALRTITVIDTTSANIKGIDYSTTEPTNKGITVTITGDENLVIDGWDCKKASCTKTYSDNINEKVIVKDSSGNETKIPVVINNIDKTSPILTNPVSSNPDPTNENVIITIEADEDILIDGFTCSANICTKIYEQNTNEVVLVKDLAGNSSSQTITITNIDKTPPVIKKLTPSIETKTNGDVVLIIEADEDILIEGWTCSTKTCVQTFTENTNGIESITIKDLAGNEIVKNININNIDKIAPSAVKVPSKTEPTNKDVIMKIILSEEIKDIPGWTHIGNNIYEKIYTENTKDKNGNPGLEEIIVTDLAGNNTVVTVGIENIDKIPLTAVTTYSKTDPTNEKVIVTITTNKNNVTGDLEDYECNNIEEKTICTKEYEQNINSKTIKLTDKAGNKTETIIKINNLDKVAPTLVVEYSIPSTEETNQDIMVKITGNETINIIDWTCNNKICTKTYNSNVIEDIEVKDLAGNITISNISVSNIDKINPVVTIIYTPNYLTNNSVTVTIMVDKELKEDPTGFTKQASLTYTKTYTENIEEEVILTDKAGNITNQPIRITWIDKEAPVISINGDNPYNHEAGEIYNDPGVTVTDNVTNNITPATVSNINPSQVGNYEIKYKAIDEAGNMSELIRQVNVLDTTKPVISANNINITVLTDSVVNLKDLVSVTDAGDNNIKNKLTTNMPSINTSIDGAVYTVLYNVTDESGNIADPVTITITVRESFTFNYKAEPQEFVAPMAGSYRIEAWGASGGDKKDKLGGKGAYTKGVISLSAGEKLYIYTGGHGNLSETEGGYNGGTNIDGEVLQHFYGAPGGGATDIRLVKGSAGDFNSLKSRIMVAAGGGGAFTTNICGKGDGGFGGAITGKAGERIGKSIICAEVYSETTGATAIKGGNSKYYDALGNIGVDVITAGFGIPNYVTIFFYQAGGGGGYYTGATGYNFSGSGGSSFISGHIGSNSVSETSTSTNITHTGLPVHYSGFAFTQTVMSAGNNSMPNISATGNMTGNKGNGAVKITIVK